MSATPTPRSPNSMSSSAGRFAGLAAAASAASSSAPGVAVVQDAALDRLHYRTEPQYQKGIASMDRKDYGMAAACFSKAIFLHPNEAELYMHRGEAYLKSLDINSALANFKMAITLIDDQEISASMRERLTSLLDSQGCMAFQSGHVTKAFQCFNESIPYNPDSTTLLLHRGVTRYKLGMLTDAADDFHRCTGDIILKPYPHIGLSLTAMRNNSLKEAKRHLERVTGDCGHILALQNVQAVFKHHCERRQARGTALIAEKQFEEAGRIFDELIDTNPDDAELYRLRSMCLCGLNMYSAAVQDLFESISRAGGNYSASMLQLSETLIKIAEDLTANGDDSQALEYYTEAIKWNGNVAHWYLERGECYRRLKRPESVMADFTMAVDLDPKSEEARNKLGFLFDGLGIDHYNRGDFPEAVEQFTKAIAVCSYQPLFYYHRAQCFLVNPKFHPKAILDLQQCVKLGTTNTDILRMVQHYCAGTAMMATTSTANPTPLTKATARVKATARLAPTTTRTGGVPTTRSMASPPISPTGTVATTASTASASGGSGASPRMLDTMTTTRTTASTARAGGGTTTPNTGTTRRRRLGGTETPPNAGGGGGDAAASTGGGAENDWVQQRIIRGRLGEPQFIIADDPEAMRQTLRPSPKPWVRPLKPLLPGDLDAMHFDAVLQDLRTSERFRTGKADSEILKPKGPKHTGYSEAKLRPSTRSNKPVIWSSSVRRGKYPGAKESPSFSATMPVRLQPLHYDTLKQAAAGTSTLNSRTTAVSTIGGKSQFGSTFGSGGASSTTSSSVRRSYRTLVPPKLSVRELRELKPAPAS